METQKYYIGQIFNGSYPTDVAVWCDNNNAYVEDLGNKIYEIKAIPEHIPTEEEQRQNRAFAYQQEVDPITSHIQRLRDKEQTPEIQAEIAELIAERDTKVEKIKQRYPYPTDPII